MTIKTTGTAPAGAPAPAPAPKRAAGLRAPGTYRVLQPAGRPVPFFVSFPADDDVLARLVRGDAIPREERAETRVYAGETTSDIPAVSVKELIEVGFIAEANGPNDPYATFTSATKGGE